MFRDRVAVGQRNFLPDLLSDAEAKKKNFAYAWYLSILREWDKEMHMKNKFPKICFFSTVIVVFTLLIVAAPRSAAFDLADPHTVFGVTIDSIDNMPQVIESIQKLPRRVTARVVFDEGMTASYYAPAVKLLAQHADVMGELLDSYSFKDLSQYAYEKRTKQYLDALGDSLTYWEVGNEINGEWLGKPAAVAKKVMASAKRVKARGYDTAITLYYNEGCWENAENEMFRWVNQNLPASFRATVDVVWISYYEENCNNLRPNWEPVFQTLGQLFPKSEMGFGEVGTSDVKMKADTIERYYGLKITHPRYIGGHFWWYFVQDMVPMHKPLWKKLHDQASRD
jgi:hypothetical protein